MEDEWKELEIQFDVTEIEAKTRTLKSSFSLDSMADIMAIHGDDSMRKRMEQEEFDKEISRKLDALGFGDEEDVN